MPNDSILLKNMMQLCGFRQKESSWMRYQGSKRAVRGSQW
jgi:hypothetical protein